MKSVNVVELIKAYDTLVPVDQLVIDAVVSALCKKDREIRNCVVEINKLLDDDESPSLHDRIVEMKWTMGIRDNGDFAVMIADSPVVLAICHDILEKGVCTITAWELAEHIVTVHNANRLDFSEGN